MKQVFQKDWHDIPFASFTEMSQDAPAGAEFYESFYKVFFERYGSWSELDQTWKYYKKVVAEAVCGRISGERAVLSVRFLFEGSAAQDTFPVHIDLSTPVRPDNSIVDIGGEGSGDA